MFCKKVPLYKSTKHVDISVQLVLKNFFLHIITLQPAPEKYDHSIDEQEHTVDEWKCELDQGFTDEDFGVLFKTSMPSVYPSFDVVHVKLRTMPEVVSSCFP